MATPQPSDPSVDRSTRPCAFDLFETALGTFGIAWSRDGIVRLRLPETRSEEIRVLRTADVVIELREVTHATEVDRQLAVRKVKNNQVTKRLIPFNITEKGIELSTTSRVV